jgi:GT2 family glycosyltransferase
MKNPKVSIIILNWNGWKDTIECLESLYRINFPNYDVIVVDNASTNESINMIKQWANGKIDVNSKFFRYKRRNKPLNFLEYYEDELENNTYLLKRKRFDKLSSNNKLFILKNKENYGFAKGNNIAIKQILKENCSDYILLLNNDTVVDKDFLTEMVKVAQKDKEIAVVGPKILNYSYPKLVDSVSIIIDSRGGGIDEGEGEKDIFFKNKEVFGVSGCCCLMRTDKIAKLYKKFKYIFDEDFYLYYEDVDLSWRINYLGYKSLFCHNALVFHKGSKSTEKFSTFKSFFMIRNRLFIITKYYSIKKIILALLSILKKNVSYSKDILRKNKSEKLMIKISSSVKISTVIIAVFKAYLSFLINIHKMLKKRAIIKNIKYKTE